MKRLLISLLLLCSLTTAFAGGGMQQIESLMSGIRETDGDAVSGGLAYFYLPGTLTLTTVYQDSAGSTPHPNPVTLGSDGRAQVFTNRSLRIRVTDADGVLVTDYDELVYGAGVQTIDVESFTSTSGQATFSLSGTYATATSVLRAYINGIRQASGTFTWSPPNVTFDEGLLAGWNVEFEILH